MGGIMHDAAKVGIMTYLGLKSTQTSMWMNDLTRVILFSVARRTRSGSFQVISQNLPLDPRNIGHIGPSRNEQTQRLQIDPECYIQPTRRGISSSLSFLDVWCNTSDEYGVTHIRFLVTAETRDHRNQWCGWVTYMTQWHSFAVDLGASSLIGRIQSSFPKSKSLGSAAPYF
ncbi:hypothetical protein DTO027B5_5968 [Paecilomyces variotii]|nr:hypothetical protein DTO027B3_5115 [Paecilomyces variotii]KAJ9332318.1 hypothetical protein DTO027B5_5968 [Paecilomyces variotii]KAJ9398946.1 hypothetical protein DTO282F9_4073 [Paecilomyces variotii]